MKSLFFKNKIMIPTIKELIVHQYYHIKNNIKIINFIYYIYERVKRVSYKMARVPIYDRIYKKN